MRTDRLYTHRTYLALIAGIGVAFGAVAWISAAWVPAIRPPHLNLALIGLLFALFWPVFSLSLRRIAAQQPHRAIGIGLYGLTVVSLMVFGFAKPIAVTSAVAVTTGVPLAAFALLLAWLVLELATRAPSSAIAGLAATPMPDGQQGASTALRLAA